MPSVAVFYHYFHPDDVVSAQHLTELSVELRRRGWEVEAFPSNRGCRNEALVYPPTDTHLGVSIKRVWRPAFRQASTIGRVLNATWMAMAWSLSRTNADVMIVGTDPIMSVVVALVWRRLRRDRKIVHWCFDLYPHAAVADGLATESNPAVKVARRILGRAYRACDLIVDIGSCMRAKLQADCPVMHYETSTPWALAEPGSVVEVCREERDQLFGAGVPLTLMYSGNFGRAHSFDMILALANLLAEQPVRFVFSVRGNREDALRKAVASSRLSNVTFAGFAPADRIEQRLSAADIQMVSLESGWTGVVVPSKFFGALAVGRPVLFAGDPDSSVARWIEENQVGWVLTAGSLHAVAAELTRLSKDASALPALFQRCHHVYQTHFSKQVVCDAWDRSLRRLLTAGSIG